ncbi:MAG: hypothetical protein Ta2F_16200 [Termitinemataceae bacterium]|nr:MAG: hypothetical protein Ta2F_16200 [Termitinemataceae bacterium]
MKIKLAIILCLFTQVAFAQDLLNSFFDSKPKANSEKTDMDKAVQLYGNGKWSEAITAFRSVQQKSTNNIERAEIQFWIAISELSGGLYYDSLKDLDEILRIDPNSIRAPEIPYHKARSLFYLNRFADALPLFRAYSDSIILETKYLSSPDRDSWQISDRYDSKSINYNNKAAAIYWIGECYYALGELEIAEEVFETIILYYTESHKYEASTNRIALIKQKKIEKELLALLKTSKDEYLVEQRQEQTAQPETSETKAKDKETRQNYDEAIEAYQNRIAPYIDNKNSANPSQPVQNSQSVQSGNDADVVIRLLSIKTTALEMMDRLISTLNSYEGIDTRDW